MSGSDSSDSAGRAGRAQGPGGSPSPVFAGLCATCRHMRPVRSRSGSLFRLCLLSREDPRFPRYPKLPVVQCSGYLEEDPREGEGSGSRGSGSVEEDSAESEPEGRRGDSEEVRRESESVSRSNFRSVRPSSSRSALESAFTLSTPTPRSR